MCTQMESWKKGKENERVFFNYKTKWNILNEWIEIILKFGICYIAQKVMVNNEQISFH